MRFIRLDFVLLRSVVTLVVVLAVTLSAWWPAASVSSAAEMPVGATLKVLALPVEVQPAQTETFVAGMDGQMLNQGDVVRTGPGGLALLTFFDGSESQLGAETTVQIERAEATPAPQIALLQTAGVTMNHVVPMPPGGSFQTDTPAATGLVRGTSYVVVVGLGADQSSAGDQSANQSTAPSGDSRAIDQSGAVVLAGDDASAGLTAALSVDGQASGGDGRTAFVCGPNGDQSCATSVVLLTDRDGHVGRVDVVAVNEASGAAPLQLSKAGDAATSNSGRTNAGKVAQLTLKALEAGANARNQPDAARAAEHHARVAAALLVRLTPPAPGAQPGAADGQELAASGQARSAPVAAVVVTPVVVNQDQDDQAPGPNTSGLTPTSRPTPAPKLPGTAKHEVGTPTSTTSQSGSSAASVEQPQHAPPASVPTLGPVLPGSTDKNKSGKTTPVPPTPVPPTPIVIITRVTPSPLPPTPTV